MIAGVTSMRLLRLGGRMRGEESNFTSVIHGLSECGDCIPFATWTDQP